MVKTAHWPQKHMLYCSKSKVSRLVAMAGHGQAVATPSTKKHIKTIAKIMKKQKRATKNHTNQT
jgi:hypothetical protein